MELNSFVINPGYSSLDSEKQNSFFIYKNMEMYINARENSEWYLVHEYKQEPGSIWGFGLDEKTKSIFIAPKNLELEILVDQVKFNQ